MQGPDPNYPYPFEGLPHQLENLKRTVFLKNVIKRKNIVVGDYTYYDDPRGGDNFENESVLYHYDFSVEKLIIGKFCAIAAGTKFIMSSANHKLDGFSTYPFMLFARGWDKQMRFEDFTNKGDTVVGNDVWFGYGTTIMPAVKIGSGAIIATKAVVTKDVPPYAIVGGNPAKILKFRFKEDVVAELLKIQWWNWAAEKITRNIRKIIESDLTELKNAK